MRVEARYAGSLTDLRGVCDLAGGGANCLEYGVTNHYLDAAGGGFAMAPMGSPRLRFRVYECGEYRFGHLEHKRQPTPDRTEKDVWPAEQVWDLLLPAMPWLVEEQFQTPPPGHPHAVLTVDCSERGPDLGPLVYVRGLTYRRLSCAGEGMRITADWGFSPAIVPPDEMIVETKGEGTLQDAALEALGLRALAVSKFGMLNRLEV
jgi:hypothetical protein